MQLLTSVRDRDGKNKAARCFHLAAIFVYVFIL